MTQPASALTITIPLSITEHELAKKNSRLQKDAAKGKQVYLNTLAVCAVNFYLNCLSIETSLNDSDSFNPLLLKFMDVADILLPQVGQLECRPVLPNDEVLTIPPDVCVDRMGYIAVRLESSLKKAVILGFTTTASAQIPLTELRPLEEFPAYLYQLQNSPSPESEVTAARERSAIQLSNWFKGAVEAGWQTIETLIELNSPQPIAVRNVGQIEKKIKRAKAIDLGVQLGNTSVVLALVLTALPEAAINILVQIYPSSGAPYLPGNLQLKMLSESGKILQETVSGSLNNYAQLRRFSGEQGDRFSIEITLDEVTFIESFVL